MREKKTWLVVTFYTTSAAMAAEKACLAAAVPGRIIPVPRQITSDCGLGWRTPPETRPQVEALFTSLIWRSRGTTCVSSDREMHSPRKKGTSIKISTAPSIDGSCSEATSIKFGTPVSGSA